MAITYHAGRRIQGLESDVTSSTTQGYDGGDGLGAGVTYGGGGGGGAGGAGTDCLSATTGNGGIGFINNIVGSTSGQSSGGNYYLGGGGYGGTYGGSFGSVGLGNSVGGGGSGGYRTSGGGNGIIGIVILKLLTSASFSTSGSPSSSTSGSHTILTYTSTSSSSLVISSGTVDVQYLVLGGGGGAGGNNGYGGGNGSGGGGGGGILTGTLSLSAGTYGVTVGNGGAGGSSSGTVGNNGASSVFSTLTALGGGGGAPNSGATHIQAGSAGTGGGGAGFGLSDNGTGGLAYATVTDIKPTNVQLQSRFEETDTRKMYYYNAVNEVQQLTGGSERTVMTNGNEAHYGISVRTGSALIGVSISKISLKLRMYATPTSSNLVYCRLWRGGSFIHTFGSASPSSISVGSTLYWYSFGTGGDFDGGNGTSSALQAGDRLLISWDRGGAYNSEAMAVGYTNTDVYDGTYTTDTVTTTVSPAAGNFTDGTAFDVTFKIVGTGFGTEWQELGT